MARSSAISIENNFSRGLITEATAMNFPENSVVEAENCVFDHSGKVIRRYGVNFETDYVVEEYFDLGILGNALAPEDYFEGLAITEFEWTTVNDDGSTSFVVVQIGNLLNFFQVGTTNNLTENRKTFTIDLASHQVGTFTDDEGQYVAEKECGYSSGFGYLFVTHPLCEPFYVEYDPDTDTISDVAIDVNIRDLERLDDSLDYDERPTVATSIHNYNLFNQGWYATALNAGATTDNVYNYWDAQRTDFPSNADIWWAYKNSSEEIDATLFDTVATGNTPAPNGHYIFSAWLTDRNGVFSTSGLPEVSSGNNRPSLTAFYAGRVWYAGIQSSNYSSKLFFSKIVEGVADFGICYQVNDPTSESLSDLLESDGGVINIPDIATVLRIVPVQSSLLVFASNGIWKISGVDGIFKANSYSVVKISNTSIAARNSVVVAEGLPFWWDQAGIYNIQFDPTSGQEQIVNVSETTIQSLVSDIPDANLSYVKGAYNNIDKTIHWAYKTTASSTVSENYTFNKILVLNLTGQSFSPQVISTSTPKVCGLLFTSRSNKDPLLDEAGASLVKYLCVGVFGTGDTHAFTVAQFNDDSYLDWTSWAGDGIDFSSFFITGHRIRGELLRKFQSNYVVVISEQEDNAGCLIQGVWDYSNSSLTGNYSSSQQVFKSNTERNYSRRKLKIRGNGYSLQFKFYSQTGKPFTLIGWSVSETGVNVP